MHNDIQNDSNSQNRDRLLEVVVPINRSGWTIVGSYVALFSFPFIFLGPVGLILGIVALLDIKKHPERAGRGRAWFTVIYSAVTSFILAGFVYLLVRPH